MRGVKPDEELWRRINEVLVDENAATAMVTVISGFCQLLIVAGLANNEDSARIHLAAMVLSPDDGRPVGSLISRLQAECQKIEDGKWRQ
jgi:hypothetical protein